MALSAAERKRPSHDWAGLFISELTDEWMDGWTNPIWICTFLLFFQFSLGYVAFFATPFKPFLHLQSLFFLVSWSELLLCCPCLCMWHKGGELDNLRSWVIQKKSTIHFTSDEWRLRYTLHEGLTNYRSVRWICPFWLYTFVEMLQFFLHFSFQG